MSASSFGRLHVLPQIPGQIGAIPCGSMSPGHWLRSRVWSRVQRGDWLHQDGVILLNPYYVPGPVNPKSAGTLFYDQGMPVAVNLQTVHPRKLAAVRREVSPGAVSGAYGPMATTFFSTTIRQRQARR